MGSYPDDFFHPGDIPNAFVMRDPTRLTGDKVTQLLAHLRNLQSQETVIPFSFRQVLLEDKFVKTSYPSEANLIEQVFLNKNDLTDEEDTEANEEELTEDSPTIGLRAPAAPVASVLPTTSRTIELDRLPVSTQDGNANIVHSPTGSPISHHSSLPQALYLPSGEQQNSQWDLHSHSHRFLEGTNHRVAEERSQLMGSLASRPSPPHLTYPGFGYQLEPVEVSSIDTYYNQVGDGTSKYCVMLY